MNKKYLFIYYQNIKPNGVSKVLANLTWELAEKGHNVEVLYLMERHDDFYPMHPKIKKHYVSSFANKYAKIGTKILKKYSHLPKAYNIHSYFYDYGSYEVMNNWIKENHHHYDTIITCWYKLSSMLSLNKEVSKKTIAWEHISYKTGGLLWNNTLRKYYKNLKAVVCINKGGIDHYKKWNKNTYLISNLVDEYLEKLAFIPFSKKENLISIICRLDPEKNLIAFLEIFFKSNIPNDWKVEIMGQGREIEYLQKFIEENNLQKRIKFLGHGSSEDVYRLMARSKISCLTSINEAFGMVLLEAMFSSNALIAYDCHYGPSDIINDKNGFLIPLHDQKTFQEKLQYLTHNTEVLKNLITSSYQDAQNWKNDKVVQQWIKVF